MPVCSKKMVFTKKLFWNVDPDSIDLDKHARFVIERVLTRGSADDFSELQRTYGKDRIRQELRNCRSLDPKTIRFCRVTIKGSNVENRISLLQSHRDSVGMVLVVCRSCTGSLGKFYFLRLTPFVFELQKFPPLPAGAQRRIFLT